MKKTHKIIIASMMLAGTSAYAQDYIWTGAIDSDFDNAGNWTQGGVVPATPPTTSNPTQYNGGVANNVDFNTGGTSVVNAIYVSPATTGGVLNVSNGTLQGSGQNTRYTYGNGGRTATVNITGTGVIDVGGGTRVGIDSGSVGTVNISGDGAYRNGRGYTQHGIGISTGVGINNATGSINVSENGTYEDRFGIMLGDYGNAGTGAGTFNVTGANTDVNIGVLTSSSDGKWFQSTGSTLGGFVDSSDFSLGPINIFDHGTPTDGVVSFEAGALLNLGFTGAAPTTTITWTLMTFADGFAFTDGGLALSDGTDDKWSFAFADTGGTADLNALQVTYTVPEPSTYALLAGAFALSAVMIRRRRA